MGVPSRALAARPSANETFALGSAFASSAWALSWASWADTSSPPSSQTLITAYPNSKRVRILVSSIKLASASFTLFDKDPGRLQERKGDQADNRRRGNQRRVIDVPAKQHHQAEQRHQHCEPVANGNLPQQDAGP